MSPKMGCEAPFRSVARNTKLQLRGVEIEVFAAPWIDPEDIKFPYESPGGIFLGQTEGRCRILCEMGAPN
jgi:hypothetical protein